MAIGGTSKMRNLLARNRLQKRRSVRRVLLETLESRQLLAVGPQLIGVQPNNSELLSDGQVLQVSPSELIFRFNDGAGIDPATLNGIRVVRSGEDGVFERASIATDFSTAGQTLVEFYAETPGQAGNGIELRFTTASRTDTRLPVLRVTGNRVDVELNSNPLLETRVSDLLEAFQRNSGSAASSLVFALPLRGSQTIAIGRTTDTSRSLVLTGANAAKAATNFGLGNNLEVRFVARDAGSTGLGTTVNVTRQDLGGAGAPTVTVTGKTINVRLNSNPRFATTVREFVDAINTHPTASTLIEAQLVSGGAATRIGSAATTYSPIVLAGVTDIEVIPAYIGLGDSDREVVLRFGESLPDDVYRIEILGQGQRTLRNVAGEAFNSGISRSIAFELDLGVRIVSIVPQPVTRDPASGALSWDRTNEIDIYFTDDALIDVRNIVSVNGLSLAQLRAERDGVLYLQNSDTIVFASGSAQRGVLVPEFYQLINSRGTLDTSDDAAVEYPTRIRYYPEANRATLRFQRDLDQYAEVGGELRLTVGSNAPRPLAPVTLDASAAAADPGDTFASPLNLATAATPWTPGVGGASQSVLIDSRIQNETPFVLDFPGGSDEPGNRQIRMQDNLRLGADSVDGITTFYYNFQGQLTSRDGTFLNAITEQQKQRVREVLSLYERYLGVRFVESADKGLTVGVGDLRAVNPFPDIAGGGFGRTETNQPGFTAFEAGTLTGGQLATVLDSQDFDSSTVNAFGGTFSRAAMQAIGQLLGLGDADELEQLTIQSFASVFAPGVGTEIILPGDADIVHGQFLYRPDSKDIDLYQFTLPASGGLPTSGRLSIEVFAERMSTGSLLDSQIRLFQQVDGGWQEIAANDDYYSSDSYLELDLAPGNYILGVSASGNDTYDPRIADSGLGGRSQGSYQLRMDFQPPAPSVLRDADSTLGTEFDGDSDGVPGGKFDFWFRPSNDGTTKFVDKLAPAGGNGLIDAPYKTIGAALAAARPGDVVRIVGNGGADRNFATTSDNLAYEIGFDSQGRALSDGGTLDVPKDVALVIDAGAVLKMRRARLGVGSTTVSVDRSGSSLMVLGTPTLQTADGRVLANSAGNPLSGSVIMTSLNDATSSAASAAASGAAAAGDWGGIDFRRRVDLANGRENLEQEGIFLNWVAGAELRYGGGQVVVDGVSQSITPIQMIDARPSIVNNFITLSSDAAMSATPDSFLESNFHSPGEQASAPAPFSVDYDRVGPDIHGNRLLNNSINALQVRVQTSSATQLEKMTVQGRFDDKDIVHYIPENLEIQGTPGGAIEPTGTTQIVNRLDARLAIDPGTVVKSRGARIEVAFGSQLIAEGNGSSPVVFTSLSDIRYGAGGTFVTANGTAVPTLQPGNWGGIYVGHTSSASLDHAVVAYGGGETRIEGGFADFSAIEVHQGDLRLANSRLENNADGTSIVSSGQRAGRGNNAEGVVFVRGAQPVVIDNLFLNNVGPAITANLSSLNSDLVVDTGRSTGMMERIDGQGNQGPLIRGNLMSGPEQINGLVVRGAKPTAQNPNQISGDILTTEGVWDDTDIVHVVLDQIVVPNFHAFGGLNLKSSSSESLVIKLQSQNSVAGDVAGFTATGRRQDIADRIGGSIRVLGTPGHPVVMTSLNDSSAGAGFTPAGDPQHATIVDTTAPTPGSWRSILLDPNSNDRNVLLVTENESAVSGSPNSNGTPSTAQFLGGLAAHEYDGDENRRLGFEIRGTLSAASDADVYSFNAQAGTEVWLDIDRTHNSLDTVVELVDANGTVLAASNDSLAEEAGLMPLTINGLPTESVNPLRLSTPELYFQSATGAPKDLYSTNPLDAGFRVSLPGAVGTSNLYHVRVRSTGDSQGMYHLQVRLSEVDEVPGSSISHADIRYAETGIQLIGVPANSPLLGESSEAENRPGGNNTFSTNAQALGNLLQTNRQAISVAGSIDSSTDVDWFSFDIDYQNLRPSSIREYFATVFDVDYADGLGRPDTSIYVFDSRGYLILGGLGSDLVDDQAAPLSGAGNADLSRGSAGTLDPYVDSFELPAGRYYVAVTNNTRMPQDLTQFTVANTTNPLVRLQPIESVRLIAEDHVASNGGSTAAAPIVSDLFVGNSAAVPWNLSDVVLYVSRDVGAQTDIFAVNPFTGETVINFNNRQNVDIEDIAFRSTGELQAFDRALIGAQPADLDTGINYVTINSGTGAFTVGGTTGLETFHVEAPGAPPVPAAVASNDGVHPEAITFGTIAGSERGFFVGNRPSPAGVTPVYDTLVPPPFPNALPNVGNARPGPDYFSNILYEFDVTSGAAVGATRTGVLQGDQGAGTNIVERGRIITEPTGATPTSLIAREATRTQAGSLQRVLRDGDFFTIEDRTGVPINRTFEFDFGPEVTLNYNPATNGIRDGMRFTLDGVNYEFDTGSVVVVDATDGSALSDGATVTIRNAAGVTKVFEFDVDGTFSAGNVPVAFTAGDSQADLVRGLTTAVNADRSFNVIAEAVAGSNRISFIGASTTDAIVVSGVGLSVSGGVGAPGGTRIAISEAATENQFANAIASAMPSGLIASYEAGRLNFSGVTSANFGDLSAAGIFSVVRTSSGVGTGRIPINVLASDSAETVALRMVNAINGLGIVGFSAVLDLADPVRVNMDPARARLVNTGPLTSAGVAPGGIVTGVAIVGSDLFAVSDEGGLYRVSNPQGTGIRSTYVGTSYDLVGIRFTGLSTVSGAVTSTGSQLLFGVDSAGVIHAFDTAGRLQPVFANGATSIRTGLSRANGLAFSTLQSNLWSQTTTADNTNRETNPGHGLLATPNNSRGSTNGGTSYYFGDNTLVNTNFPGGAAGALESRPFSLAGLSAADMPMLYFNYFIDTEHTNNANNNNPVTNGANMRDAFRVYASGEDGNWILLATNNTDTNSARELATNADVQPLFNRNDNWRQARVPLARLAGQENIKLRFEFSTGGGFGYGLTGGKGPEIRTISGDRLVDGQTLSIGGQLFEIEMGPTLTLPARESISNGQSVTIDGTRFVFTDGTLPVVAPDVAVVLDSTDLTAAQITAKLETAVAAAGSVIPVVGGLNFSENNDTLDRAIPTPVRGDNIRVIGTGTIGDRLTDPDEDVDFARIELKPGSQLRVNVNTTAIGSLLNSHIRLFNFEGREVADSAVSGGDSQLTFTASAGGTYYIGVSGVGNQAYDAVLPGLTSVGSSGDYELVIEVVLPLTPVRDGNRLQLPGASVVSVSPGAGIRLQGATGAASGSVPVRVTNGMSSEQVAAALQQAIADNFSGGRTASYPTRGDIISLTGLSVANAGPFGLTRTFLGESRSNTFNSPLRAQNNDNEGVYLDDFIIGIAGRGEMVLQPRAGGTGVAGDTNFVADPNATSQIQTGPYQFEIRGGEEYGLPAPGGINLRETFPLNGRSAPGLSIRFNDASQLVAGDTFTVGDGPRVVIFELDDIDDSRGVAAGNVALTFSTSVPLAGGSTTSETAEIIAARFRDLLNSAAIQQQISVIGNLDNNDRSGATSDTVVLIGNATATIPPTVGEKIVSTTTGGANRSRPQGQVVVNGVRVSDSANFGVSIAAAPRDAVTGAPLSGVPRNTIVLNTEQLSVGAVIMNSELLFNNAGGISITGDSQLTSNTAPDATRSFVRLVNNTIVGGSIAADNSLTVGGTGISVTNNATATLLNNVIANSTTGINIDASSGSTVVGGTVFNNNADGSGTTPGQFPITTSNNLFRDLASGNLYPTSDSEVIDSSIDSLQDRPSLVAVKQPLGLSASPILTPLFDINGQLRVDDPSVETPAGLGENVFKDRGAQDRADFAGPSLILLNPIDNDFAGADKNPANGIIELSGTTLRSFDIQLVDGLAPSDPSLGSGIDDATVNSSSVLIFGPKVVDGVRQQNQPLVEGRDYVFGYDATNNTIRLTPLAGIWEPESVYTVRFINTAASALVAQASYTDGEQISIVDSTGTNTVFEIDSGYVITVPPLPADPTLADGRTFSLDDGIRRVVFEIDIDGVITDGNRPVSVVSATTVEGVGRLIENAINNAALNLTVTEIGPGVLQIQGSRLVQFDPMDSGLTSTGRPGVQTAFGIQIPLNAGNPQGLADGQTFTIVRAGTPTTFELNTSGSIAAGNQAVSFDADATTDQIAQAIVDAINAAAIGLTPQNAGNGLVTLGGNASTVLDVSQTALLQSGLAGQPAAVAIPVSAAVGQSSDELAEVIKRAIDAQNLPGIETTRFGDRILVEGGRSTAGVGTSAIAPIRDLAGNPLKANQANGETSVSIFLGEGLDYGDAPAPYRSTNLQNGPRHTVISGLSLGPTVDADADARLDDADIDDGVTFGRLTAAFDSRATIEVRNTTGSDAYVSLWIDLDGNGIFAASEQIVSSQLVADPSVTDPSTQLYEMTFTFGIPKSTPDELTPNPSKLGPTFARVRVSSNPTAVDSPLGAAPDGEVEDYQVQIHANPYQNATGVLDDAGNGMDVSGDGFASAIDVLQVINWINDDSINPATGQPNKPNTLRLADATGSPPFVDVNGDGLVSALDVNLLVTYINSQPRTGIGSPEGEALAEGEADGTTDSTGLAASQQFVLGSDWANGLETLGQRRAATEAEAVKSHGQALLQAQDELNEIAASVVSAGTASSVAHYWADLGQAGDDSDSIGAAVVDDLLEALSQNLL